VGNLGLLCHERYIVWWNINSIFVTWLTLWKMSSTVSEALRQGRQQ
jgi:hypothetical protein